MEENKIDDVKYQPVEKRAVNILREYTGNNNFLISLKNDVKRGDTNLGRKVSEYVVKNYDKKVIGINQWFNIDGYCGEELQKKFLCVDKPTKIYIQKILADTDKAVHIWGKVWEDQTMSDMWLPKHSIIKPKHTNKVDINNIDFTKYNRQPLPHQIPAVQKLLENDRFILGDSMGLGKSAEAIMAALESGVERILIVCPASLKLNWKKEIEMLDKTSVINIIDGKKWISGGKWTIVNYDILKNFHTVRDKRKKDQVLITHITDEKFDLIIGDECQMLKNKQADRSKIFHDFAQDVKRLWLLTGTPITNRPIDYFHLLELCNHRIARNWVGFVVRYCAGKQFYGKGRRKIWDTKGASYLDELHENTQDIILRRRKEEILDLPEKIIQPIYLPLRKPSEYKEIVGEYESWAEHQQNFNLALHLAQLVKLRQFLAMSKIESTIEIAENAIDEGKKVIIFTNFTEPIHQFQYHFGKRCVIHHGPMTKNKREESIEEFQNNPEVKVFVGNIISAGIGITLTAAELVIFNDLSWLPADHLQASDRCYRVGQLKKVNVYYNIVDETLDLYLFESLMKKIKVIDQVMGDSNLDVDIYNEVIKKIKKK